VEIPVLEVSAFSKSLKVKTSALYLERLILVHYIFHLQLGI
jgi:hypothetical protein